MAKPMESQRSLMKFSDRLKKLHDAEAIARVSRESKIDSFACCVFRRCHDKTCETKILRVVTQFD